MNLSKVKKFVKKFGYDGAEYRGEWNRYQVYEPTIEDDKPANVGKPEFVLVLGDSIRMATEDEVFEYIDSLPDDEEYEEEEETNVGKVAKTFLEIIEDRNVSKMAPSMVDVVHEVETIEVVHKFNPNHDALGRFCSGSGGGGAAAGSASTAESEAKSLVAKAKKREPKLTAILKNCAKEAGGEMVGLEYAVKGEGSLTRKIKTEMAEKGVTAKEAAASMRDVNRYTMQLTEDNFAAGYKSTMAALQKSGCEIARVKNTLKNPNAEYRGVNTNIKNPDGSIWELQFHTAKSLEVKEVNHKLYEKQRLDTTPAAEKAELGRQMAQNAASIPTPKGIETIG